MKILTKRSSRKVFISNVQIVAGPELENQAPELTATDAYLLPEETLILQGVTVR